MALDGTPPREPKETGSGAGIFWVRESDSLYYSKIAAWVFFPLGHAYIREPDSIQAEGRPKPSSSSLPSAGSKAPDLLDSTHTHTDKQSRHTPLFTQFTTPTGTHTHSLSVSSLSHTHTLTTRAQHPLRTAPPGMKRGSFSSSNSSINLQGKKQETRPRVRVAYPPVPEDPTTAREYCNSQGFARHKCTRGRGGVCLCVCVCDAMVPSVLRGRLCRKI